MPNTTEDIINDELSESMKQVAQTINGLLAEKDRRIAELEASLADLKQARRDDVAAIMEGR